MKTLPKEYCVLLFQDLEKVAEILKYYNRTSTDLNTYDYIRVRDRGDGMVAFTYFNFKPTHLPENVFSFEEWKQLTSMKKYTKQEVIDGDFAVEVKNEEEFNRMNSEFDLKYSGGFSFLKGATKSLYLFPCKNTWSNTANSRTTSISVSEIDFEEEFVLPKTWYVKVTQENKAEIGKWATYDIPVGKIAGMYDWGGREGISRANSDPDVLTVEHKNFGQEITTEQFRKYVLKKENMKKIVGYKVPYNIAITEEPWKKGEMSFINPSLINSKDYNYVVKGLRGSLPREIVETWEPLYKKEAVNMKIKSSSGDFNVRISEDGIQAEGETISIQSLYLLTDSAKIGTNIGSWKASYSYVTIGCKKNIPLEEITRIIVEYEKFNS